MVVPDERRSERLVGVTVNEMLMMLYILDLDGYIMPCLITVEISQS